MDGIYIYDIIVIGLGPAGIGFLNAIDEQTNLKVGFIEKGGDARHRTCNVLINNDCEFCNRELCNILYGIGGASLLGGHKISALPAGTFLKGIIEQNQSIAYYEKQIMYLKSLLNTTSVDINKKKIATATKLYNDIGYDFKYYDSLFCSINDLRKAYEYIINEKKNFIDIKLNTEVINIEKKSFFEIETVGNKGRDIIYAKKIVFAVGRTGKDLFYKLNKKLSLGAKDNHLEVGVRIEFPTILFDDIDKYHNDLKLIRNNIRTFCISKNGMLSPYYQDGLFIVDGFIDKCNPTQYTNLALMLRLDEISSPDIYKKIRDNIFNGIDNKPIIQNYLSFSANKQTYDNVFNSSIRFLRPGCIKNIYPDIILEKIKKEVDFFISTFFKEKDFDKINIIAPSIEYYWPTFSIDNSFSVNQGIYLIGDCSGNFRGILQAYISGSILGNKLMV